MVPRTVGGNEPSSSLPFDEREDEVGETEVSSVPG